jgi:hypothetical protein
MKLTKRERLTKAEILERAKSVFNSSIRWINWIGAPKAHNFVTECESNIRFDGADFYAKYKSYTLDVFVWYREKVTADDLLLERKFEDKVREMGSFEKECGYNNADNLFYSHYMFTLKEEMPTFEEE